MMHNSLRLLDSKLAEVLGRQERIVSLLSSQQLQTQQPPQVGGDALLHHFKMMQSNILFTNLNFFQI